MNERRFGGCCEDLARAMDEVPEPFFRVEDSGVLYMSVGCVRTDDGFGYYDAAVRFCPFCGTEVQTAEEIRARAGAPED